MSPYTQLGLNATGSLGGLYGYGNLVTDGTGNYSFDPNSAAAAKTAAMGNFFTSPGYDFRLQQGINALDRSGAARGMELSGAQAKGVNDYAQGQASSEWGNYLAQLNQMSGQGQNAQMGVNNTAAGLVANANNGLVGISDQELKGNMARANSYSSSANALANGIGSGVNSLATIGAYGAGQGWFGGSPAQPSPVPPQGNPYYQTSNV